MSTPDEVKERITEDGVEFIYAMFVEMHGKPCAKLVPVTAIDDLFEVGAGFAGFAAGPLSQTPADPDILALPDPASYVRLPWQPNVAAMQCDPTVDGEEWPYAPRIILKRALARAAEKNLVLKSGVEVEYSLLAREPDGSLRPADERDTSALPCYDARGLTTALDHLTTVSRHMDAMGWGNYANDHEDANGQFEQNFGYADAMTTSDRLIILRLMLHTLARERDLYATFMPKPFADKTGNGLHTHLSLWSADADEPLFHDDSDPRGLGLSGLAYQFIAGILDHAKGLTAVVCPTVNSFKRIGVGPPDSGATWAPAYAAYGGNNRTQMIRVPEGGRIECRIPDGSANPYLAFTALLSAGLDGVACASDPGDPNVDNLYTLPLAEIRSRGIEALPPTLLHACDGLVADDVLRDGFGSGRDGDYVDYFADVKRAEFRSITDRVSPAEVDAYLSLM
ncbi:MAG TPA: type III glutamate--ammonia ligase [Acidimicrobiaceae bacterium]|nr:type III glutamate--ammonia ligase [Acidimicrobiaceae bacterium]HCV34156.1 type III glutamate--ammonia ligase [Acidimicrobiaceae bacterium]|tara:strand:+ start:8507 stop:9862 length:1356 start_codon:yes stop_codon:yes gene_type:complete